MLKYQYQTPDNTQDNDTEWITLRFELEII